MERKKHTARSIGVDLDPTVIEAWQARSVPGPQLHCTDAANRVFDRCIQVHGGMGLTNELRLEAGYRFTRSMRIPDGTSEIQRRTIARDLLANGVHF